MEVTAVTHAQETRLPVDYATRICGVRTGISRSSVDGAFCTPSGGTITVSTTIHSVVLRIHAIVQLFIGRDGIVDIRRGWG